MFGLRLTPEGEKFLALFIGVAAFLAVVGGLLLLLDKGADLLGWLGRRRRGERAAPVRRRPARDLWTALVFLAPAGLLIAVGLLVPLVRTSLFSFRDRFGVEGVGLENYRWMFTQGDILVVLRNSAVWVVLAPLAVTAIGLVYAVLVDRSRFEWFAKSLVFMPMAISFVGASIIWKFVYEVRPEGADQIGLLNQVWVWLGFPPKNWLVERAGALNTLLLIVILVWIYVGFAMVVLSASIKAIPAEIVEAAKIDGTNPWQMFWRITLPTIRPAVVVVLITVFIASLKLFDIVRTMTGGNFGTSVVANEMFTQAFSQGQLGRGSALAVILFLFVLPIAYYQIRVIRQRRKEAM
jgi:alpha-glucoside transport system permease protein